MSLKVVSACGAVADLNLVLGHHPHMGEVLGRIQSPQQGADLTGSIARNHDEVPTLGIHYPGRHVDRSSHIRNLAGNSWMGPAGWARLFVARRAEQ
jgi:hypothetical protein